MFAPVPTVPVERSPPALTPRGDLVAAYVVACQTGAWEGKINIATLLGEMGSTLRIFPCPDGSDLRVQRRVGFNGKPVDPIVTKITFRDGVFTIWMSGATTHGTPVDKCLTFTKNGSEWALTVRARPESELLESYRVAEKTGRWTGNVDVTSLFTERALARGTFLSPDGSSQKSAFGVGFLRTFDQFHLLEVTHDNGRFCLHLRASANTTGPDPTTTTMDVRLEFYQVAGEWHHKSFTPTQYELLGAYRKVHRSGTWSGDIDITSLMQKDQHGTLSSFLVPDEDTAHRVLALGLPGGSQNVHVIGMQYVFGRYELFVRGEKDGKTTTACVLLFRTDDYWDTLPLEPSQYQLYSAYRIVDWVGDYRCSISLSPFTLGKHGFGTSFLRPDNRTLVHDYMAHGLPENPEDAKCDRMTFDEGTYTYYLSSRVGAGRAHSRVELSQPFGSWRSSAYTVAQHELLSAFREARRTGEWNGEIDLASQTYTEGGAAESWVLPSGETLGRTVSIGLGKIPGKRVLRKILYRDGTWTFFPRIEDNGLTKHISCVELRWYGPAGWTFKNCTMPQYRLKRIYEKIERKGSWRGDFDLSSFFDLKQGRVLGSFVKPGGMLLRKTQSHGLGIELTQAKLVRARKLSDFEYLLLLKGQKENGKSARTVVRVSGDGFFKPDMKASADVQKGLVVDRYVRHLLALAGETGVAGQNVRLSRITDELLRPNILSPDVVYHVKWGAAGKDSLIHGMKYIRLLAHVNGGGELRLVLATPDHEPALADKLSRVGRTVGVAVRVSTIEGLTARLGVSAEPKRELARIRTAATNGHAAYLQKIAYSPTLPNATNAQINNTRRWTEILDDIPDQELLSDLMLLKRSHSVLFELSYQVNLAMRLSYLYENRTIARTAILDVMPELRDLPLDAWRFIERIDRTALEKSEIGGNAHYVPDLLVFSLQAFLADRGFTSTTAVAAKTDPVSGGAAALGSMAFKDTTFYMLNQILKDSGIFRGLADLANSVAIAQKLKLRPLAPAEADALRMTIAQRVLIELAAVFPDELEDRGVDFVQVPNLLDFEAMLDGLPERTLTGGVRSSSVSNLVKGAISCISAAMSA